jgi:hypothetical protein
MTSKVQSVCKITKWAKYNESLVQRGSITFWLDEEVVEQWAHANSVRKVGRPFVYSDRAIECLLTLRELFRLAYRQTEGLGRSLAQLMKVKLAIPDFTSLAKRAARLKFQLAVAPSKGAIDIVVDSTGLKVFGEGEWKMRQHGASKRRTWRKLHLAVNPATHEIVAEVLTENSGTDADQVGELLDQVPERINTFYGDGGYDQWKVYNRLQKQQIQPIIPPQKNAKIKQHGNSNEAPLVRDEAVRGIRRLGRKAWKKEIGYHRRSLAETAVFRIKTIFGGLLKNRLLPNQQTESRLRCKILNKINLLGLPQFEWS